MKSVVAHGPSMSILSKWYEKQEELIRSGKVYDNDRSRLMNGRWKNVAMKDRTHQ